MTGKEGAGTGGIISSFSEKSLYTPESLIESWRRDALDEEDREVEGFGALWDVTEEDDVDFVGVTVCS